ncbi:amidohydrolase [Crassaminicella indica]|uniref:Peptidase M20 domain-containing protein 2 n=1 Tax=Crassaminicella indica TaxID=2855394 RepID=A0ABX8R8W2_9CLOT|nr:amidohydrolase [Crassaminicella indica]QXM05236.1 amidohydrolase [Crassaminicella indica]
MDKKQLKEKVCQVIDKNKEKIIRLGESIYNHPELGYKEVYATNFISEELEKLGLTVEKNIAVTGCRARLNAENEGPRVAVLGEMDAVICKEHIDADPETGAVHACGHNIQVASMFGVAVGLTLSGALEKLGGKVDFLAVPAEEYVELEYRSKLKEKGKIKYFGGKQELIYRGYFDDVDIAMMMHVLNLGDKKVLIGGKGNGFVGKNVQFIGKESHAGGAPEKGINALNAAMLAINNIHAQRETFPESERIRVHPIMTKGGDIVNVIPADVRMEMYVRGRTIQGILDANKKVNRSLKAGAMAIGAKVKINEIPGYLPLLNHDELDNIFKLNILDFVKKEEIIEDGDFTGSFDFGDVSHLMPSLHPFIGGIKGELHTRNFKNEDHELCYIVPAKSMAMTIIDLLWDEGKVAKKMIKDFTPKMTKEEYVGFLEKISGVITE